MLVLLESIAGNLYSNLLVELTVGPFPMKGMYKSSLILNIRMRVRLNIEQSARSLFLEALQSRSLINVTMIVILIRINVPMSTRVHVNSTYLNSQSHLFRGGKPCIYTLMYRWVTNKRTSTEVVTY